MGMLGPLDSMQDIWPEVAKVKASMEAKSIMETADK
jgi:hypothetical protein